LGTLRVLLILAFVLTLVSFVIGRLWKNNVMLYGVSILSGAAIFGLLIVGYGSNRFDMETKYYAIRVEHQPDHGEHAYSLTLDHLMHSIVRLDDPTWLYYKHEYVQAELLLLSRSRNIETNLLVIGGGGYTFPRYVEHLMPDVHIDVVEIDPGVTKIAHDKLGLARDAKLRTFNLDGRQFVSERAAKGKYQLVMQDAVNDLSVPGHLMTKEYNDAVKTILAPNGAYLLTLIDDLQRGKLWRAAFHTMRETFKHVVMIGSHPLIANDGTVHRGRSVYIIYGSDTPLDMNGLRQLLMQHRIGRELDSLPPWIWTPPIEQVPQFVLGWMMERFTFTVDDETIETLLQQQKKIVLTDQYCPVDNLMADVFREQAKGKR
jgi:spermidine synthase